MKYSSYKTIFVPLLLLFLLFAPKTWAQENQKQVPGLLINHHFFAKEMPMQEIFSVQKGFQRLDDGEPILSFPRHGRNMKSHGKTLSMPTSLKPVHAFSMKWQRQLTTEINS